MHISATHHTFLATDSVVLPGLLYEPKAPSNEIVIWLHGMGDSGVFYSPKRITALARELTQRGVSLFAFNNRGAHNSKTLRKDNPELDKKDQRYQAGTYFELIKDCVADINGAVAFLKEQGYTSFHLAGHSTGANKICVYDDLSTDNPFSRYVLAGPGDDVGLMYESLGKKTFRKALDYANQKIRSGRPLHVMPQYTGMHPFSAQSAADILDPNGSYNTFPYYESVHGKLGGKKFFREYQKINKPMLVIAGSEDEAAATAGGAKEALALLKSNTNQAILAESDFQIVADTDHSFHGSEDAFAEKVALWLTK